MTYMTTLLKAAAAVFLCIILMLLLQLDLTAFQTAETLFPGWGWLAFLTLLALEAAAFCWLGLSWFARAPRLVLRDDPTDEERRAFAAELERRLKKNSHVRQAGISPQQPDFLEKALDVLDARAGEEIRSNARRVFLGTALSQNGRLDALIVFVSLARMVWRVSGIYNQRPTPAELWSVYSAVSSATFISFSIDALDIPRTITESMNELLPAVAPAMAASGMPFMGPVMQQCTTAVIDGAANCLLAVRAGVVTRSAFCFAALGQDEARRRACVRETGAILSEISRETVGAIVGAFRKQLADLPGAVGQKISETVGNMADTALEKTRDAAGSVIRGTKDCAGSAGQAVLRGGSAVVDAVSDGAHAVAGAVSTGAGAVADAVGQGTSAVLGTVGDCAGSAGQAVLRGGSAVVDAVSGGAHAVAGAVSTGAGAVADAVGQGTSAVLGTVGDCAGSAGQAVLRGGSAVVDAVSGGAHAVAGAVSTGAGAVADAVGQGTSAVLGAVRAVLPGRRREATADERFALRLALIWSQGRPGWMRRRQLARFCDAEGVSAGLRTLVDRHPELRLLEPHLDFWRGQDEAVAACGRELGLERGPAAVAWLAELDAHLRLGGRLQDGGSAPSGPSTPPASARRPFWKR